MKDMVDTDMFGEGKVFTNRYFGYRASQVALVVKSTCQCRRHKLGVF